MGREEEREEGRGRIEMMVPVSGLMTWWSGARRVRRRSINDRVSVWCIPTCGRWTSRRRRPQTAETNQSPVSVWPCAVLLVYRPVLCLIVPCRAVPCRVVLCFNPYVQLRLDTFHSFISSFIIYSLVRL